MRYGLLALVGVFVFAASVVQAQNLVANPGFETGDFTGWTVTGGNFSVETNVGHTGQFAASLGAVAPDVVDLSQTLVTKIGQQYNLTFFAQTPEFNIQPGFPNTLSVFFGGSLIAGPVTVPDGPNYEQYNYVVTATSTTSLLRFLVSNDPDFTQLDDVSVTALTAAVPEPGATSLFAICGFSGAGFLLRRCRK